MMKTFIFLSLLFVNVPFVFAQSPGNEQNSMINLIRQKAGFAAEVPATICNKTFPFHKTIPQKLASNNSTDSFGLFSFTATAFDSTKPSILFIQGGPGGLWGPKEAIESSNQFPDANIVFFHYRGGGCSAFNSNNAELDKYITSDGTIRDMEAIRNAYGITTWKSVIGFSYGTDVARRYAHRFPNRIQSLVLEGLNSSDELPPDQVITRILKTISNRYKASSNLQSRISADDFKNFITTLQSYFSQISPSQNFGLAALWEFYQKTYADYYSAAGIPIPKYLNRNTFLSVTLLMYAGESGSSDIAILMLMNNFNFGQIPPEQGSMIAAALQSLDKFMFPFLYQDYLSVLSSSGLLSWRVQLTMPGNDKVESSDSVCSS